MALAVGCTMMILMILTETGKMYVLVLIPNVSLYMCTGLIYDVFQLKYFLKGTKMLYHGARYFTCLKIPLTFQLSSTHT